MTINEIKGIFEIAPMTPEKARINSLKRSKDAATKNLKTERDRQKVSNAQHQIATIKSSTLAM